MCFRGSFKFLVCHNPPGLKMKLKFPIHKQKTAWEVYKKAIGNPALVLLNSNLKQKKQVGMAKGPLSSIACGERGCSRNSLLLELCWYSTVLQLQSCAGPKPVCMLCLNSGGGGGIDRHIYTWEVSSYHLLPASQAQPPHTWRPRFALWFPQTPPSLHLCVAVAQTGTVLPSQPLADDALISLWHLPASCQCSRVHIWEQIF